MRALHNQLMKLGMSWSVKRLATVNCIFVMCFVSVAATAQRNTYYFESDGSFRHCEPGKPGNNSVRFIMEADSNSVYLLATSQSVNYSLPGIGIKPKLLSIDNNLFSKLETKANVQKAAGVKDGAIILKSDYEKYMKKHGGGKGKGATKKGKGGVGNGVPQDALWDVKLDKNKKHLFYRIYRFPKALLYENFEPKTNYNKLYWHLNKQAEGLVEKKRVGLWLWLEKLSYAEFDQLNSTFHRLRDTKRQLEEAQENLASLLSAQDSLSKEDKAGYFELTEKKRLYLQEIEAYDEYSSTDNAIEYMKAVREKYMEVIKELAEYEMKKSGFRMARKKALRLDIARLTYQISVISKNELLQSFMELVGDLNKTYHYSLDILYEGHINIGEDIQEVGYSHHYNDITQASILERRTPILPTLTNRDYLSVVVHNVPAQLMTKQGNVPFELSLEPDSLSKAEIGFDRLKMDELGDLLGIKGLQGDEYMEHNFFNTKDAESDLCQSFEEEVGNMKLGEIIVSTINDENKGKEVDTCLLKLEGHLKQTAKIRDALYEIVASYGSGKVAQPTIPIYRDYVMGSGKRFTPGKAPVILINGPKRNIYKKGQVIFDKTTLVRDSLENVQRLRRFDISFGVAASNLATYQSYLVPIEGTSYKKLVEERAIKTTVRPVMFLSGYLRPQNMDAPSKLAGSINVGVGFDNGNLLDNLYFGYGIEVMRHVQFNLGIAMGKVDKADTDSYNPVDETFVVSQQWEMGPYVSANIYLNTFTKTLSTFFSK